MPPSVTSTQARPAITRRHLGIGAAGGTLSVLLAACAGSQAGTQSGSHRTDEAITVLFFDYQPFFQVFRSVLTPGFTSSARVAVQLTPVPAASYNAVNDKIISDKIGGTLPDLALVGLNSLRFYAEYKLAVSLDTFIGRDKTFARSDYAADVMKLGQYNGRTYGIPLGYALPALYYNAKIFRKAGLDPDQPPATYSELKTAATKIVSSRAATYGANLNYDSSDNFETQLAVYSNGGTFMNTAQTSFTFDQAPAVQVIQFWQDLAKTGAAPPQTKAEELQAFLRGDLGMFFQVGETNAALSSPEVELRVAKPPVPDGGTLRAPTAGAMLMMLATDPQRQAAVWKTIKALIGPEGGDAVIKYYGVIPPNLTAVKNSAFIAQNPGLAITSQELPDAIPWYQFPGLHAEEIQANLQNAVLTARLGGNVAATLQAAAVQSQPLLP
jgi:multiple sugar transport system substrate-binding protein